MSGSKQKYNFERALSALRATQSKVGGRVAQDPTTEVNIPLDNLQSSDHKTGEDRATQSCSNSNYENDGDNGGSYSTVEAPSSSYGTAGGYDGTSVGRKRGSDDSSTTQGQVSFGDRDDDDDTFWMDSDDAHENTGKDTEMFSVDPGYSAAIPKGLENTAENKLEQGEQNETDGDVDMNGDEVSGAKKRCGVGGSESTGENRDSGTFNEDEETSREYVVVIMESNAEEHDKDEGVDENDEEWHDSNDGGGERQHYPAEGEGEEHADGKDAITPNAGVTDSLDGANENIEEHSNSGGHSSAGEEDSDDNDDETSDSDDLDVGEEACNNDCNGDAAVSDINNDVATQTNFRQGFLKSFKEQQPDVKIGRRNSEPFNMKSAEGNKNGRTLWDKVYEWSKRRRSNKATLRGYIQGRGGGLVIPGRPLSPPSNQGPPSPTILQAYINVMYYLAVSTRELDQHKPWEKKLGQLAQKIWFWIFAILAIGYSIDVVKFCTLEFLDDGKLHDYVQLGFLLVYGVTRVYSILLHGFKNEKILEMVKCMNDATLGNCSTKYVRLLAWLLGGGSLTLAALTSVFGHLAFKEWSWKNIILLRAYEMGHTLFIWSATNYQNVTDKIDADYSSEMNFTTWALAVPEVALAFCGSLQDFVIGDLMLTSGASLFSNTSRYVKDLKSKPARHVSYEVFREKWNQYQVIAEASDQFYEICGTLLTLYHVFNLLQFTVFLRFMLVKKTAHIVFITSLVNVIKSMVTYVYAVKISEKNQICRNWVRHCAFHSLAKKKQKRKRLYMQAMLMLDEMKDNPLGFGRDELYINKGFLITFLGMAASLFVMIAEYAEESGKTC